MARSARKPSATSARDPLCPFSSSTRPAKTISVLRGRGLDFASSQSAETNTATLPAGPAGAAAIDATAEADAPERRVVGGAAAEKQSAAALALTANGFLTSLLFVVYRSPDILLTQILIETLPRLRPPCRVAVVGPAGPTTSSRTGSTGPT